MCRTTVAGDSFELDQMMPMDLSLLAFLALSIVVIATPGPDTALTVRNTFLGGRSVGALTALGVSVAQILWSVATSLGLVGLLLASKPVFQGVKLVGAVYLIYLGIRSLYSACLDSPLLGPSIGRLPSMSLSGSAAFRQGVINNLANPKMAGCFAIVLPHFAPR